MARPSGTGYVRYEDLYRAGDTVSAAINRLTTAATITFPQGVFEFSDFKGVPGTPAAPYGIFLPHLCLGLIGSGPGVPGSTTTGTIFRIKAGTSSVRRLPQDNHTPNPACMIYASTGLAAGHVYEYAQFQIIGTSQQNTYWGFCPARQPGPVWMHDLVSFGGSRADNGAPPGEAKAFTIGGPNGPHRMERVYVDGNNVGGGIHVQDAHGPILRSCVSKNTITAPYSFYQSFSGQTFDLIAGPNPWSPGTLSGTVQAPPVPTPQQPNMNHERTSGWVHTRPVQVGVLANHGVNMTHSNDNYTEAIDGFSCSTVNGSLTFIDPTFAPSEGSYIEMQSWSPYSNGDTMRTPPIVKRSNGTHIPYKWNHGNKVIVVN